MTDMDYDIEDFDRPVEAPPEIIADLWKYFHSNDSLATTIYAQRTHGLEPPTFPPGASWILVFDATDPANPIPYWLGPDASQMIDEEWAQYNQPVDAPPDVIAELEQLSAANTMSPRELAKHAQTHHGLTPPDGPPLARWEINIAHLNEWDDNGPTELYWIRPYPDAPNQQYLNDH